MDKILEEKSTLLSGILTDLAALMHGNVRNLCFSEKQILVSLNLPARDSIGSASPHEVTLIMDPTDLRDAAFSSLRDGLYEDLITQLLFDFAAKSSFFLDVGSNIGFYAVSLAKSFPKITVHAIEPNLKVGNRWEQNSAVNGVGSRAILHRVALSSASGESDFFVPGVTGTGGGSRRMLHPEEPQEKMVVSLATPDQLRLPDNFDLIKVDVEGAEFDVISSLEGRIDSSLPTICIELLRKWMAPFGHHPQEILALLSRKGYRVFAIGLDSISEIDEIDDKTIETNFLFVHEHNGAHLEIASRFASEKAKTS